MTCFRAYQTWLHSRGGQIIWLWGHFDKDALAEGRTSDLIIK